MNLSAQIRKSVSAHIPATTAATYVEGLLLIAILIIAAWLRLGGLGQWSLWTDEVYTVNLVQRLRILTEGIPDDQHPPLYHILTHAWTHYGQGEFWLRLPSAVFSLLSIPLMAHLGILLGKRRLGLLAAALTAVSPILIWYGREARMYGMASFLWIAAIYFYARALCRGRWFDAVGLAAAMSAAIATTYASLALWVLQLSFFGLFWHLSGRSRKTLIGWWLAQLLIAGALWLWLPYLELQLGRARLFEWPVLADMGISFSTTLAGVLGLALIAALAVVAAGHLLLAVAVKRPHWLSQTARQRKQIAAIILLIFLLGTLAGAIPCGLSIRRQLLVFWPLVLLAAAWALEHVQRRWLTGGILLLSLLLSIGMLLGGAYENWRGAAAYVSAQATVTDEVVVTPVWNARTFAYYAQDELLFQGIRPGDLSGQSYAPGQRVWLVINRHPTLQPDTAGIEAWFRRHGRLISEKSFSRHLAVFEYEMVETR